MTFEEIGKEKTAHVGQSSDVFKQPIPGRYHSLYKELKVRCAPENFMDPYEPEKVSKANELYSEVLATDAHDDGKLKRLRSRAMEELGVQFSTELLYEKLSAVCNPKNFTGDAYDKERLKLANRLYQAVLKNADNVVALEEIEDVALEQLEPFVAPPTPNGSGTVYGMPHLAIQTICVVILILVLLISIIFSVLINPYVR